MTADTDPAGPFPGAQHRTVEYLPIDTLVPHPDNPKRHVVADIDASMARWGYTEPVLLDERTGRLAAGHGRIETLLAARAAGRQPPDGVLVELGGVADTWFVPVVRGWSSRDDAEAQAYLVASNRLTEKGGWDEGALTRLLEEVRGAGAPFDGIGWSTDDLDGMLADLAAGAPKPRPVVEPDDVADEVATVASAGDVWVLGDHRLVVGDSAGDAVERAAAGQPVDVLWTDPPYGVSYVGGTGMTIEGDDLDEAGLAALLAGVFDACDRVMSAGARFYVAHPGGRLSRVFLEAVASRWRLHETLVWVKDQMVLGHLDYHPRHEPVAFGYKEAHQPIEFGYKKGPGRWGRGAQGWYGGDNQTSVLEVPRPKRSSAHPTMKPVALIERCLANSSQPGDVILDPFAGSGSTLIAAHRLGRRAVLVEKDVRYADAIIARYQAFTGDYGHLENESVRGT